MAKSYNNWEQFYHRFNLIFNGLVALSLLPFAFVFLETQKEYPDPPVMTDVEGLFIKVILVVICAVTVAYSQMYKKTIPQKVIVRDEIKPRLDLYLRLKLQQYAILEVAAIGAMVGLYLTKDQLFSFIYVVVLFVYSLSRPTFDSVSSEIRVPEKDLKQWGAGEEE